MQFLFLYFFGLALSTSVLAMSVEGLITESLNDPEFLNDKSILCKFFPELHSAEPVASSSSKLEIVKIPVPTDVRIIRDNVKQAQLLLNKVIADYNISDKKEFLEDFIMNDELVDKPGGPIPDQEPPLWAKFSRAKFECRNVIKFDKRFRDQAKDDENLAHILKIYQFEKDDGVEPCVIIMKAGYGESLEAIEEDKSMSGAHKIGYYLAKLHDTYKTGHGDAEPSNILYDCYEEIEKVVFIDHLSMATWDKADPFSSDIITFTKALVMGFKSATMNKKDERKNVILSFFHGYIEYFSKLKNFEYSLKDFSVISK